MIAFSELVVEKAGVFIAYGNDDITDRQIRFIEQAYRFLKALFLEQTAKRHTA